MVSASCPLRMGLWCCLLLFSRESFVNASRFGFSRSFLSPTLRTKPKVHVSKGFQKALLMDRGGDQEEVLTLDEKVAKAMKKLGVGPATSGSSEPQSTAEGECNDGVCRMPHAAEQEDTETVATRIAKDMNVDPSLVMAALGATSTVDSSNSRKYNEAMARSMIQQELDMINAVPEDSKDVQQLVEEGYNDSFLVRRALAFAENNLDDARAILLAEKMDEEEEERNAAAATQQPEQQPEMKTVTVDSNFDPATIGAKKPTPATTPTPALAPGGMPSPAKKGDVVFEATTAQIQQLVIESPVPVLLDIHAEWCGPCKVLGPVLEDMAVKAGGIFRLVKVNSDNERAVSAALEVTALPSVFGVRDGKIQHMFQGMPKSEEFMKSFMMGLLMPGGNFNPPVTAEEERKYEELSSKLAKTAGAASFSFAAREVLQDRISSKLDDLVKAQNGDLVDTEESVQILRSLLSNVIKNPYESKFRKVNLANKVLAAKISKYQPCLAILKSVGFVQQDGDTLMIGKGKRLVNVAPLTVARDYLDKWVDKTRYDVAKAARKRKDENALKELEESGALDAVEEEEEESEDEADVDPNKCELKVRIVGKNKVHEVSLNADDPLSMVIESLPSVSKQKEEIQITCVAKRLVVKSTDKAAMKKSLREHKLLPTAAIVVNVGAKEKTDSSAKSSLAERAAAERQRKTGSHTMQSIGVYAKDDNAKGELIDGGGGSLWEQDVTSDEEDEAAEVGSEEDAAADQDNEEKADHEEEGDSSAD